jgi:hypothetical protein
LAPLALAFQDSKTPLGSPYVPLDIWVYPALFRLAAMGYVTGQLTDTLPWTRAECRRQINEASSRESFELSYYVERRGDSVRSLIADLQAEFPEAEQSTEFRALRRNSWDMPELLNLG